MGLIPSTIPVTHLPWVPTLDGNGNQVVDNHGNDVGTLGDPVSRMAVAVYPLEWETASPDVVSPDYAERVVFNIEMIVDDASVYKKLDQVVVNGLDYEVQSIPYNWGWGLPFPNPSYGNLIGGTVHLRKVT